MSVIYEQAPFVKALMEPVSVSAAEAQPKPPMHTCNNTATTTDGRPPPACATGFGVGRPVRGAGGGQIIGRTVPSIRRVTRGMATDALARALFETDEEVMSFVLGRAECCGWDGVGTWEAFDTARQARADAAMDRAWERGCAGASPERAWYARAADRAALVGAKLREP